jgi:microcystin-dependent protein
MGIKTNRYVPSGALFSLPSTTIPAGYLLCDGSAVSRTTYASLFSIIGVAHGSGNGTTTFNLPDYRGRFLRGLDGTAGNDPDKASRTAMNSGGNTGNNIGSIQPDAIQGHFHEYRYSSFSTNGGGNALTQQNQLDPNIDTNGNHVRGPTTDGVNGTPRATSESRPKNANVNIIIKI